MDFVVIDVEENGHITETGISEYLFCRILRRASEILQKIDDALEEYYYTAP